MGIDRDRLILDPGFGQGHYGKNTPENFYLLAHLDEFSDLSLPMLVGWSRKSMLGEVLGGVGVDERLYASLAAALLSVIRGAAFVRCHDVRETLDVLQVYRAFCKYGDINESIN
jgi:dihydropteroate synthase